MVTRSDIPWRRSKEELQAYLLDKTEEWKQDGLSYFHILFLSCRVCSDLCVANLKLEVAKMLGLVEKLPGKDN